MSTIERPLRADAERNRKKLLAAAHDVFARHGLDAGVEEVAREAGVGVGTLYRRFPTKESLVEAVVAERFESMGAAFSVAAGEHDDPWESFRAGAAGLAEAIAADHGFFQVVSETVAREPSVRALRDRMLLVLEPVVVRAQEAGELRTDISARDIPGLCAVAARLPRWKLEEDPDVWRRYLRVVLDGLRVRG